MKAEETIWEEMYRFIDSIKDEIRSDDPEISSIDFWCFKLRRRVKILESQKFELRYCELCIQMTNHIDGTCQKCKPTTDNSIFSQVESSVLEMTGVARNEITQHRRYGQLPTARQLIVRILRDLDYSPKEILENFPYMTKIASINSRYSASFRFEKYDPKFRRVLEQLQEQFIVNK